MPKLLVFLFILFGIFLFFTQATPVQADAITIAASPETVNLGDPVTITVINIPKGTAIQVLLQFLMGSVAGQQVAAIQVDTSRGNCYLQNASSWPAPSGSTPSCTTTEPFTLTLPIDTSKIEFDKNSQTRMTYIAILGGGGITPARATFTIQPTTSAPRTFFIKSIAPETAKPGESLQITLLINNKFGRYIYSMPPGPANTVNCESSSTTCTFALSIPTYITTPEADIVIIDPDGNRKTQEKFPIILPKPITNKLPVATSQSCTPEDAANGKCTSSGGIRCNTSDGTSNPSGDGISTAIGCVPTDPQKLIQGLFRVAIGAGGAVALLLMIGGAFQFITSAGNPEAVKKGSEMFTSAIVGLLIIVMATMLLKIIGVDILSIPGFEK